MQESILHGTSCTAECTALSDGLCHDAAQAVHCSMVAFLIIAGCCVLWDPLICVTASACRHASLFAHCGMTEASTG